MVMNVSETSMAAVGAYFEEEYHVTLSEAMLRMYMEPTSLARKLARDAARKGVHLCARNGELISMDENESESYLASLKIRLAPATTAIA